MSCHADCLTCSLPGVFNGCLTCYSQMTLINGVCYCTPYSDNLCRTVLPVKIMSMLNLISSAYGLVFALCFIFYYLEIRTRYFYRMVSALQMISYGIYFQVYYSAETQQLLRTMFKANGGMFQTYRNQPIDNYYTVPTAVTAACCLLAYFGGYWLVLAFTNRKYLSYGQYLIDCAFKLLQSFFFFHSKQLFYFSALYIKTIMNTASIASTTPLVNVAVLYMIVILMYYVIVLVKYQRRTLRIAIFSKTFYLYSMLAPMVLMLVPLTGLTYVVYCCQLGMFVLVMLIGKHRITRSKIIFFFGEGLFILLSIIYFAVDNVTQIWYGTALLGLFLCLSLAEIVYVFWFERPDTQAEVVPTNPNILDCDPQQATMADINHKNGGTEMIDNSPSIPNI